MPNFKQRIFVYGTLRKDFEHEMYHVLARTAKFVGDAVTYGELYELGEYPGLLLNGETSDEVLGELYELNSGDVETTLRLLDSYEECGPDDPQPHEYLRQLINVKLRGHATEKAWAYVLRNRPKDKERIVSGNYLTWRRRKMATLANVDS
jgi:gamma-glutamylcyclotransferase (GGCT)/AIG2-like uncharacterized protein YtfP